MYKVLKDKPKPQNIAIFNEYNNIYGYYLALKIKNLNNEVNITIYENSSEKSQLPIILSVDSNNNLDHYLQIEDDKRYFSPNKICRITNDNKLSNNKVFNNKVYNIKKYISISLYKLFFDGLKDKDGKEFCYSQSYEKYANNLELPQLSTELAIAQNIIDINSPIYNMFDNVDIKEFLGNIGTKQIYKQNQEILLKKIKIVLQEKDIDINNSKIIKFTNTKVYTIDNIDNIDNFDNFDNVNNFDDIDFYDKIICCNNFIVDKYQYKKPIKQKHLIKTPFYYATLIINEKNTLPFDFFIRKNSNINPNKPHIINAIVYDDTICNEKKYYIYGKYNINEENINTKIINEEKFVQEIKKELRDIFKNLNDTNFKIIDINNIEKYFGYKSKSIKKEVHFKIHKHNKNNNNVYFHILNMKLNDVSKIAYNCLNIKKNLIDKIFFN